MPAWIIRDTIESDINGVCFGRDIGFATGVYESYEEGNAKLQSCMRVKGYKVF